ncbi:CYTH domain-containing protein [Pseudodesulfovibrio sp. JC047]|uniref:class IV adenylate cyclase n=1 Tax=Pseudodesulfovibrio sp. JC047 TaxID=2683199 RepID=UPI0013D7E7D8|nr:class IV adenylate cyclase [Pseudodesulfovibrio sp. JC047]NDV19761.1 CYTH domain-containing protein [Pseudodesulfovibrio sp. JC047]
MVLECELKFLRVDLESLSLRLQEAGATHLGKYFESNLVFDDAERSLKQHSILLRLRHKQGKAILTVKRPPLVEVPSSLKVFDEIETRVGDFLTMKTALEVIGFKVFFSYEKIREQWRFMDCVICLDLLPFGCFVEIEGTEAAVHACAKAIGLDGHETTTKTYHTLNRIDRQAKGLASDESFVFADEVRARLVAQLEKE